MNKFYWLAMHTLNFITGNDKHKFQSNEETTNDEEEETFVDWYNRTYK